MFKSICVIALVAVSASANAIGWTQSERAGHCGAFQLAMDNVGKAQVAMNFATNKGEMQQAARNWILLLREDKKKAAERGVLACSMLGVR